MIADWQSRVRSLLENYDASNNLEQFETLVTEPEPITTWEQLDEWFKPFAKGGCFRGHRAADWKLVTTLDRAVMKHIRIETHDINIDSISRINPLENEKKLLLDFQRGAYRHYDGLPELDQTVDWLALMQHFGAPTRLLDWTTSPYVALYFALQTDSSEDSALWAVNQLWLEKRSYEVISTQFPDCPKKRDDQVWWRFINKIILAERTEYPIIVAAHPFRLNERMSIQQGQLLSNLRHDISFSTALLGMLVKPTAMQEQVVSRVVLKRDQRVQFLEALRRMNIHSASLFPSLDGFAQSLAVNLEIDVAHQIEEHKEEAIKRIREARRGRQQHS